MNKLKYLAVITLSSLIAASCSQTVIKGEIDGMQDSELVVKQLSVNVVTVLDTVKTNTGGCFSYKPQVEKGQPQFIYLYKGDKALASLLVEQGDKITIKADTLGNYTVEGSEESEKLLQLNKDYSSFMASFNKIAERLATLDPASEEGKSVSKEISKLYIDYYRSRLVYITENPKSLTVIPVLYQQVNPALPVFSQKSDALRFRAACDSLKTVYPNSKYVRALEDETARRTQVMELSMRIAEAPSRDYPEIEMPDIKGNKVKLSEVKSKVILLQFWDAAQPAQKMLNQDVLKPIYNEFHSKGLEIFQVALTKDKAVWATTVRTQELPWICVNDGLGNASYISSSLYNVTVLPLAFLIVDGQLVPTNVSDLASLRKELKKYL